MLEAAVQDLKSVIFEHDGHNAADRAFSRRVDELIDAFYDDIAEVTTVPTRTLFDMFVIKVLYVDRSSTDARVVDYLGRLLDRYLYTQDLFRVSAGGAMRPYYISDLLQEMVDLRRFQNLFEAFRDYGDHSLFITGIFPQALRRGRRGRWGRTVSFVDRSYYVTSGKHCYRMASQHELAEDTQQRDVLEKLSDYFEVYLEALNEVSQRYIMGFDMRLIADKLLDSLNSYRETGEERFLRNMSRYAAILHVAPDALADVLRRSGKVR